MDMLDVRKPSIYFLLRLNRNRVPFLTSEQTMISFEYIRKILAEQFKISEARIMPESRLGDDLGMDSLDVVEIIMTVEKSTT